MVEYACAAKHLCKELNRAEPGFPVFRCKECKLPMHEHCTGLSCQPSYSFFNAHGGRTCALCASNQVTNFFTSPEGQALNNSRFQATPASLPPLPIQKSQTTPASCMLGKIPIYATNGKNTTDKQLVLLFILKTCYSC